MAETRELTTREKLSYGSGHFGVSAITESLLLLALFFYSSDAGGTRVPFVTRRLTGLAMLFGRIVNAIGDPVVGIWSDRTRTRWGRRIPFIAGGLLPLGAVYIMGWMPPVKELSWVNAVYAAVIFGVFNFLFSVVICPYLALMPDIARTTRDRLSTMTYQSVLNFAGVAMGMLGAFLLPSHLGYPGMAMVLSAVLVLSTLPTIFGPRERVPPQPTTEALVRSIRITFANPHFIWYVLAFSLQWMGVRMVLATVADYVSSVVGEPVERAAVVMLSTFIFSMLTFPLVPRLTRAVGRRAVFRWACVMLACLTMCMALIGVVGLPISRLAQMVVLLALAGIPTAMLFVVPYTMLADIIEYDAERHGVRREATYFGVQGLVVKLSWGIAEFIAAQLLEYLGPSGRTESVLGLRLIGPVAAAFFVAAFFAIKHYKLGERPAWPDTGDRAGGRTDEQA